MWRSNYGVVWNVKLIPVYTGCPGISTTFVTDRPN